MSDTPTLDCSQFEKDQHYDVAAFIALRDWMETILKKNGCEITDAGLGMGRADLGFTHQGAQFGLSIWPRIKS